jgi:single-stranded-DNA-specific exonuclease
MREDAEAEVDRAFALSGALEPALAVFDPSFHEGVVGIIAARLKDRLHRPTFVFATGLDGALKGSGRSIEGFHLRDALDLVSKRHPGLLLRFGGHAMAAGCTLAAADLDTFRSALQQVAAEGLGTSAAAQTILSDGPLAAAHFDPATVRLLDDQVWGNAFDAPIFSDTVDVVSQRLVGDKHLKLALRVDGVMRDAIWFGRSDPVGERVRIAWRLGLDAYNGIERVQMIVVAVEDAPR